METKAVQKQDDQYYLACQNCGTTSRPLQMIPLRNDGNVVGLITSCNDCKDILYGKKFDREEKLQPQEQVTVKEIHEILFQKLEVDGNRVAQQYWIDSKSKQAAAQAVHSLVYGEKPPKAEK